MTETQRRILEYLARFASADGPRPSAWPEAPEITRALTLPPDTAETALVGLEVSGYVRRVVPGAPAAARPGYELTRAGRRALGA